MGSNYDLQDKTSRFSREKVLEAIAEAEKAQQTDTAVAPPRKEKSGPAAEERAAQRCEKQLVLLERRRFSLSMRFIFCLFAACLLGWMDTAAVNGYPLPPFVSIRNSPFGFAVAHYLLLIFAAALGGKNLFMGFISIFRLKPNNAGPAALSTFGALTTGIYLLFYPQSLSDKAICIYASAAAACIALHLLARLMHVSRARYGLLAFLAYENMQAVRTLPFGDPSGRLAFPSGGDVLDGYFERVNAPTVSDRAARVLSPVVLIIAALLFAFGLVGGRGVYESLAAFALACCAGSPAAFDLCASLPMRRLAKKLFRRKAFYAGYEAVDAFAETSLMFFNAGMLFPGPAAKVHGIKTFGKTQIETAILDAASMVQAAEGPLAEAFLALIGEENRGALKTVEHLVYLDEKGLSGEIEGRKVYLGNRSLLRSGGVTPPSREYEAKYAAQGRDILYLADEDGLAALFIVEYGAEKSLTPVLRRLERTGMTLLVEPSDPNITPSMICDKFGLKYSSVILCGVAEAERIRTEAAAENPPALAAFCGKLRPFGETVVGCLRLRGTIKAALTVQLTGAALGAGLAAYLMNAGAQPLDPYVLLLFQAIFALPALLIAALRRD